MSLCSLIETYREGAVVSIICLYSSVLILLQKPVNVNRPDGQKTNSRNHLFYTVTIKKLWHKKARNPPQK